MLIKQVSVMACGPFLWVKPDIILLGRLHRQIKCILNPLYPTLKSTLVKCYNHMMYAIIYSEFRVIISLLTLPLKLRQQIRIDRYQIPYQLMVQIVGQHRCTYTAGFRKIQVNMPIHLLFFFSFFLFIHLFIFLFCLISNRTALQFVLCVTQLVPFIPICK